MASSTTPHATLLADLESLDADTRAALAGAGFDRARFLTLAASVTQGDATSRRRERNAVRGEVTAPRPGEVLSPPAEGTPEHTRLRERGEEALRAGELAFCTMAGGMATRMGGIVKALAEVWDGHTFLALRLRENATASARYGRPVPMWLMTSDATDQPLRAALRTAKAGDHIATFPQDLSLRLNPDGSLFRGDDGAPSLHATGHGDLVDALRRTKLLESFRANGGKYVWITNIDNLGATVDPALLGLFIEGGADVQCEVCKKEGDKGGIPVHADGKLQVVEEFRLPVGFDPTTVDVFNTNTFLVRAEPLATANLTWTFFEVEKKVDGRPAFQFERLIQEITAHLPSRYVAVPRAGAASRFLPVKDFDELARRRANIEVVARARGMV